MQEHEKVSQAVLKSFTLDPDKWALDQLSKNELKECEQAFEVIIDTLNGVFTGYQECLLSDMKELMQQEVDRRDNELYRKL